MFRFRIDKLFVTGSGVTGSGATYDTCGSPSFSICFRTFTNYRAAKFNIGRGERQQLRRISIEVR